MANSTLKKVNLNFMKKIFIVILSLHLLLQQNVFAQVQTNAAEIYLGLNKLNTLGSVLYIAAHPDDENTRLLSYLAKERNVRTAYLSITRGDGGQNLIGKEQGESLGLIRTQELLAARKVDGAEQFFTRANDFGYSKNPEETFQFWNKDSILEDVVWVIRNFKPDVIICRFPTTGEGGHGHHTASAILAEEAFTAAADASKFPHQLKYTQVWQAKRVFWNTFNFGGTNTTDSSQLKVNVGVYNVFTGKSYGEVAAESRSNHKSQGFGSAKTRGNTLEFFKQIKGDIASKDLFEGINQSWDRLNSCTSIKEKISKCIDTYSIAHPENSVDALIEIHTLLQNKDEKNSEFLYWKKLKLKEIEQLIVSCSGLWCEASAVDYIGIPGTEMELNVQFVNRNQVKLTCKCISFFNQYDTLLNLTPKLNELVSIKHREKLNPNLPFSSPYWLNHAHGVGQYYVANKLWIGKAENDSPLNVFFDLEINGKNFRIERPVVFKSTDPVKGEVYRPVEIVPPVTVNLSERVYVFADNNPKKIQLILRSNKSAIEGKIVATVAKGWKLIMDTNEFKIANKGTELVINGMLTPPQNGGEAKLEIGIQLGAATYSLAIKRVEYDHIPYQFILTKSEAKLVCIDVKEAGLNIGFIPGAGDEIVDCLKQIGYHVTLLTDELLAKENLLEYNTIITGVRAYNTNERLQQFYPRLMDYVNLGGNLIVQYNTNNRIGPLLAKIGPYPFTISRDRVTDEYAPMQFLKPDHAVLNYPNKIAPADFDNWVQERGIYFATEIDKNYESIFSVSDKNESAKEGSLIIGKYGKGNFAYTGLAFFRQLPAGNTGAYRLFVNLLSLQKQP